MHSMYSERRVCTDWTGKQLTEQLTAIVSCYKNINNKTENYRPPNSTDAMKCDNSGRVHDSDVVKAKILRPRPGPSRPEVQGQGSQTVTILHFFAIVV
jgi:hypothetical protein